MLKNKIITISDGTSEIIIIFLLLKLNSNNFDNQNFYLTSFASCLEVILNIYDKNIKKNFLILRKHFFNIKKKIK